MDITGINLPSPLAPHKTNFKMGRFYSSDSVGPKFNSLQVQVYTHNLWRGNGKFPRGRQVIFIGVIISLKVYFWIHTSAENVLIFFARLLSFLSFFLIAYFSWKSSLQIWQDGRHVSLQWWGTWWNGRTQKEERCVQFQFVTMLVKNCVIRECPIKHKG